MNAEPDEPVPETPHLLRVTESPTRAGDWELVLASAGIAHRLIQGQGRFALLVGTDDAANAAAALDAYDAEGAPVVVPPAPDLGPSGLGVVAAAALLAMFAVAGARDGGLPSRWFTAGTAVAELIMRGQWWRTITALCLHADLLHVVGNVIACLIFLSAVGRWLGPGLGGLLVVGSAAVANGLTALVKRHDYASVGASTATFAALGLLAGLQLVRRWRYDMRRRYVWLPLGAGLGLFAMLGVSQNADVWAHGFGLAVGAAVGAGVAASGVKTPGRIGQGLLVLAASAVFIGAWLVAFRSIGGGP